MKTRIVKWAGITLCALTLLGVVALLGARLASTLRLGERFPVRDFEVPAISTGEEAVAEGKRLFAARGCADCHGLDGAGKVAIQDDLLGKVMGANLTSGKGGVGGRLSDADFVRVLRSCVTPEGRSLVVMPCEETRLLADAEVAQLRAYVKSLPPVDHEVIPEQLTFVGHVLTGFGVLPIVSAARIDFDAPIPAAPPPAATATYGEHLAKVQCVGCHGEGLSGGRIPGAPPSMPIPANITPDKATGIGAWTRDQFVQLLQTGKRPNGTEVNSMMPWANFKHLNEQEMDALWAFLQTRPAKAFGGR